MRGHLPSLFLGFFLLQAATLPSFAQVENPNPGPRSEEDANVIFEKGSEAFSQKKFSNSILNLSRFVERYPAHPKTNEAYALLVDSLFQEKKFEEVLTRGKELLFRNPAEILANRARTLIAEANLFLKEYLDARLMAQELLKSNPNDKQKATAYSIAFQCLLEEKQYQEAEAKLDGLVSFLETTPIESFSKLIPEFRMTLEMRKCMTSHLLKNKQFSGLEDDDDPQFTEEELMEYFTKKNLCFKSALPTVLNVSNRDVIHEWCESFTEINHEIEKLRIDLFLKQKISKELKSTFEFSKTLSPDLSKCYVPYKAPKTKKRHRKRRLHSS